MKLFDRHHQLTAAAFKLGYVEETVNAEGLTTRVYYRPDTKKYVLLCGGKYRDYDSLDRARFDRTRLLSGQRAYHVKEGY